MSTPPSGPHQGQPISVVETLPGMARAVMILVHGRGATADNILDLADSFHHNGIVYMAPQASGNSWYPYSFLAPLEQNEPGLSSGLQVLADLVDHVATAGIAPERIFLGGFSQGACLTAEYAARHARRYAGLLLFSGGLIGPPGTPRDYAGSLAGTPVFIGCSDVDPHIPLARVQETTSVLRELGAEVDEQIYPGMGHTINDDEIARANRLIAAARAQLEPVTNPAKGGTEQ